MKTQRRVIKILHILATPRAEGTPNLVLDWLKTELHQQEVLVLDPDPAELTVELRAASNWYQEFDDHLLGGWKSFFSIVKHVRDVCSERRPTLVICWVHGLAPWICVGAKLGGVEHILVHAGNPPTRSYKHDWLTRYVNWPLTFVGAKVVCCSHYVRNTLQSVPWVPKGLFEVVHNCSRIEAIQRRASQAKLTRHSLEPLAVMVATLEAHKDHRTLLAALPLVVQRIPRFKLLLVGDGSLRQDLEQMVDTLNLRDVVRFLGSRKDVPELLGQADLFIFSTTSQEGLGSVLIEAMAADLAIVASDVPACREVLDDGKLGSLVPAGNREALAKEVVDRLTLPRDDERLKKLRAQALARYTPKKMIRDYLGLLPLEAEGEDGSLMI